MIQPWRRLGFELLMLVGFVLDRKIETNNCERIDERYSRAFVFTSYKWFSFFFLSFYSLFKVYVPISIRRTTFNGLSRPRGILLTQLFPSAPYSS